MKKLMMILILWNVWTIKTVQAASVVDLSTVENEATFKAVLAAFAALETVESQVTIENATQESLVTMVYDQAVAGMKHTTQIPEAELTSGMTLVVYLYDNGVEVSDMVKLLESTVAWTSKYDPNYEARVQEIAAAVDGRLVKAEADNEAFTGFHLQGYQFFLNPDWQFSDFTVEGDLVKATVDLSDYLTANEERLVTYYPQGTHYSLVLEVDQAAQTLTSKMTLDIDEDLQREVYGNQVYANLQSAMTDTLISATHQATSERVPALEDLETISFEDYEEITAVLQQ
ncbi:hypothetical protein ACTQ45_10490 [Fundicoccus sp. Sow4_D5]|uniref:hypothetical protein n=1 Tax=Fundicoccus sp. Sow4_D5 TaxID=3438782 RepID=UPI003F8ED615